MTKYMYCYPLKYHEIIVQSYYSLSIQNVCVTTDWRLPSTVSLRDRFVYLLVHEYKAKQNNIVTKR